MAYFKSKISKQTEMNGNDNDKNQPHGKLKWLDIVILIGVVVAATIFILFYFNQWLKSRNRELDKEY